MNATNTQITIQAICTDIDGTLLNRDRELSATTIDTVRQVGQSLPVILASSRMPSAMRHLQRQMEITEHPMIAYNGGYVLQYERGNLLPQIIYSTEIPLELCKHILNLGVSTSLHFSLYQDDNWYAPRDDEWTQREARITKVSAQLMSADDVISLWSKHNRGAHKIMIMGKAEEISMLESRMSKELSSDIHVYHSKDTYLEIAPKIISKASALQILLDKLYGYSMKEVMAFGDNFNDVELLKHVGLGIAVANARPAVREVSKEITEASVHDGVALAIRKYLAGYYSP